MSFASFKRIIEEGDTVILYVGLSQIYAIEVKPTVANRHGVDVEYTFQSKYGALRVMDLVGKEFGSKVFLTKGYAYVLYPTPELWTLTLPHRTQILYTPDIALIITELDLRPGSVACEAGTGSGSLSHAILRAIGPNGHLYTCDFHEERVDVARKEFERHGFKTNVTVEARDVCESGWGREDIADAVFLDLPKPWDGLPHAIESIRSEGGRICSFSPCVEQVSKSCEVMRSFGLTEINTVECLQREFQFRSMILPTVEFKKVDTPVLEKASQKGLEGTPKRQKLLESDKEIETSSVREEMDTKEADEIETKQEECLEVTNEANLPKSFKLKTAIPLLKMPGHTGFLTFATVPPRNRLKQGPKSASESVIQPPDIKQSASISTASSVPECSSESSHSTCVKIDSTLTTSCQ